MTWLERRRRIRELKAEMRQMDEDIAMLRYWLEHGELEPPEKRYDLYTVIVGILSTIMLFVAFAPASFYEWVSGHPSGF